MSDSVTPWTTAHQASVHHRLPELTQTHVHWVSDAIQPSHPLSPLLLPPSIFPSIMVFQMSQFFASGGQSIRYQVLAKVSASMVSTQGALWWPRWVGWGWMWGRKVQEGRAICIQTDSLQGTAETNATLWSNYISIKKKNTLVIVTMIILVIILWTSPLTCGLGAHPQHFLCTHMPPITFPILS